MEGRAERVSAAGRGLNDGKASRGGNKAVRIRSVCSGKSWVVYCGKSRIVAATAVCSGNKPCVVEISRGPVAWFCPCSLFVFAVWLLFPSGLLLFSV